MKGNEMNGMAIMNLRRNGGSVSTFMPSALSFSWMNTEREVRAGRSMYGSEREQRVKNKYCLHMAKDMASFAIDLTIFLTKIASINMLKIQNCSKYLQISSKICIFFGK